MVGRCGPFTGASRVPLLAVLTFRQQAGAAVPFAIAAVAWAFRFRTNADPTVMLALFLACTVTASPYLLVYDLLPLTFALVALLASSSLDAPGRRLVQLVYWTPALQLALGTWHVPGPALIAPALVAWLLIRLRNAPRPVLP